MLPCKGMTWGRLNRLTTVEAIRPSAQSAEGLSTSAPPLYTVSWKIPVQGNQ